MRVLITGGGTAGHINPGIAIAKHITARHPDAAIVFVGTQRGLEKDLVPREGFEIRFIKARGFSRKISLDILRTAWDMVLGYREARKIIKAFKPDIVIGTGGYVCVPIMLAAARLKVHTLIHESNSYPGIANRILSSIVDVAAVSFRKTEEYFKRAKRVMFTGNPIRSEILTASRDEARVSEELKPDMVLVLVFGGSQGAQRINDIVVQMIINNKGILPYKMVFSTGQTQYDWVKEILEQNGLPLEELTSIKIVPYIFDMAKALAAADLVISRAGAVTVSEITAVGVPSILIPFPHATENHQEFNARALEEQGASIVILESDLSSDILNHQIMNLINNKEQLARMARNSKKAGVVDASEKITEVIERLIEK